MLLTTKDQSYIHCEWVTGSTKLEIAAGQIEQVTKSIFCKPAYKSPQEFQTTVKSHELALQMARATSEEHVVWERLINLGIAWTSHKLTKAGDYFGEASTLARTFQDPAILAYSLNQMGNWLTEVERPLEGIDLYHKALALCEEVKDQHGIAMTLYGLGTAFATLGQVENADLCYDQASALFRALNDRVGLSLALSMRSTCGIQCLSNVSNGPGQDLAQCVQDGEESLCIAQDIGWRGGEALAFINLGLTLSSFGQYGRALKDLHSGLQIAIEIERQDWQILANIVLGAIHLDLLSLEQALEHLEQALTLSSRMGSNHWRLITLGFLVSAYTQQGNLFRAADALSLFSAGTPMQTIGQRQAWFAMAKFRLVQGDTSRALEITDQLINTIPSKLDHAECTLPRLVQLRCEILSKLNREDEIPEILESGLKSAMRQGIPSFVWRFHVWLGQISWQRRKYCLGDRHYIAARGLIERLANTISDLTLRERFLCRAGKLIPIPSSRRLAKRAFGGLTKREYGVATLIAQRKSNQEIADQLGLGDHYIKKYVDSILVKLGFHSRAQIEGWVVNRQVVNNSKRWQHKKGNKYESN